MDPRGRPYWYACCMSKQIAVRIPDELVEQLERLVEEGEYPTIAEAVRAAVAELTERKQRQRLDQAIIEGYRRLPPTPEEEAWADAASREHVVEESW